MVAASRSPWTGRDGRDVRSKVVVPALFAALALLVTFTNLGVTGEFAGYDAGLSIAMPQSSIWEVTEWNGAYAPGLPSPQAVLSIPWIGMSYILTVAGIHAMAVERLLYAALLFTASYSAYSLCALLIKMHLERDRWKHRLIAASVGGLLYAYNPYSMLLMTFPSTTHEITWSVLPIVIYLLFRGMRSVQPARDGLLFGVSCIILALGNPGLTVTSAAIAAIATCYLGLSGRVGRSGLIYLGSGLLTFIAVLIFVWLPLIVIRSNPYYATASIDSLSTNVAQAASFNSDLASLTNLFLGFGSSAFPDQQYYEWIRSSLFVPLSTVFLLGVALIVPFIIRGETYIHILFLLIFVAFVFFAKAEHGPFGQPFFWLYEHVAIFGMFRNAYDKFFIGCILSISVLVSISVCLLAVISSRAGRTMQVVVCMLACTYPLIFVAGHVADRRYIFNVPHDYVRLRSELESKVGPRTLFAAPDFGGESFLTWYHQGNASPDPLLIGVPTITEQWLRSQGISLDWSKPNVYSLTYRRVVDVLPYFGVRYVLIHRDAVNEVVPGKSSVLKVNGAAQASAINDVIRASSALQLIDVRPDYYLYEYPPARVRPVVYATTSVGSGSGLPTLMKVASTNASQVPGRRLTLLTSPPAADVGPAGWRGIPSISAAVLPPVVVPHLSYPGFRLVHIGLANGPYVLTLLQTFEPNWYAYTMPRISATAVVKIIWLALRGEGGHTGDHYVANVVANGWVFGKHQPEYLVLIYRPQVLFIVGAVFSCVSLVGILVMLLVALWRTRIVLRRNSRAADGK